MLRPIISFVVLRQSNAYTCDMILWLEGHCTDNSSSHVLTYLFAMILNSYLYEHSWYIFSSNSLPIAYELDN